MSDEKLTWVEEWFGYTPEDRRRTLYLVLVIAPLALATELGALLLEAAGTPFLDPVAPRQPASRRKKPR